MTPSTFTMLAGMIEHLSREVAELGIDSVAVNLAEQARVIRGLDAALRELIEVDDA